MYSYTCNRHGYQFEPGSVHIVNPKTHSMFYIPAELILGVFIIFLCAVTASCIINLIWEIILEESRANRFRETLAIGNKVICATDQPHATVLGVYENGTCDVVFNIAIRRVYPQQDQSIKDV